MRPTIDHRQPLISTDAATTARISTESSPHADYALLQADLDSMLSAHEMLDTSVRTFSEQRDHALDVEFPRHCAHVGDTDMVEHSAYGVDCTELMTGDEMFSAEAAALGWCDLNQ